MLGALRVPHPTGRLNIKLVDEVHNVICDVHGYHLRVHVILSFPNFACPSKMTNQLGNIPTLIGKCIPNCVNNTPQWG